MILPKIYVKDNVKIKVSNKFIYCISLYKICKNGASLLEEQYYSSNKPIKLSKKDMILKKSDYLLQRFIELEYAPEEYLLKNNFKLMDSA